LVLIVRIYYWLWQGCKPVFRAADKFLLLAGPKRILRMLQTKNTLKESPAYLGVI
jgi:hypothetical protein